MEPWFILTSRPVAEGSIPLFTPDRTIENMGFADPHIAQYVESRLAGALKSTPLLNFLHSRPEVWATAHIPIQLEICCALYQKVVDNWFSQVDQPL